MDYPILHDPGSIELLLGTVRKTDPPKQVNHDYLIGLGFRREVDEGLLRLLYFLGFIDENGQPSVLWVNSHDQKQASSILRKAVKASYGFLFKEFPNAYQEEGSTLMEFFRNSSGASDADAAYMILTFKVLCDLAEITDAESIEEPSEPVERTAVVKTESKPAISEKSADVPPMRISINIDLDDKSDPELRNLAMKLLRKQLEL